MSRGHFDVQNAKPATKPCKISGGSGFYPIVRPNAASAANEVPFSRDGAIAVIVSLADACAKRDHAKQLLETGKDPSVQRRL